MSRLPCGRGVASRLAVALLLLLLLVACDDGLYTGSFLFEGSHTFPGGETLTGDLVVRAGQADFAPGSQLDGSLYVFGGTVEMAGQVAGNVVGIGGRVRLGPQAIVAGDLYEIGAAVEVDENATVQGEVISGANAALPLADVGTERTIDDWLRLVGGALLLAGTGALLVRGRPKPFGRVGEAAVDHALVSGAMGLLLLLVLPALLVMMSFTVILLPLVGVLSLLLLILVLFGIVAVGLQLGSWVTATLGWAWTPAWQTFGGTLALLALFAIPYLGPGLLAVALVLILGALLLTRAGARQYVPEPFQPGEPETYERPSGENAIEDSDEIRPTT